MYSNKKSLMAEIVQQNLQQLKSTGKFILTVGQIREGLGLKDTEYKEFTQLNKVVIKSVLQEFATIKEIYIVAKKTSLGVVFRQVDIKDFNDRRNKC